MGGRDPEHLEELGRGSGARNAVDCQLLDHDVTEGSHGGEHGVSEPALGVVVLHGHDAASALSGILLDRLDVDRLDGEGVHHTHIHALNQFIIRKTIGFLFPFFPRYILPHNLDVSFPSYNLDILPKQI